MVVFHARSRSRATVADPWRHFRRPRRFPLFKIWHRLGEQGRAAPAWSFTVRLCLSFLRLRERAVPLEENGQSTELHGETRGRREEQRRGEISRPTFLSVWHRVLSAVFIAESEGNGFHLQKRIALVSTFWQQPAPCQFISRALTCLRPSLSFSFFVLFFLLPFFLVSGSGLTHRLLWVSLRPSFMVRLVAAGRTPGSSHLYGNRETRTRDRNEGRKETLTNVDG